MELTGGGGAPLLRVAGLRKRYPSFELRDVSLEVPAGRIVGFVGRNGAGKTTTLRCVAGAARADAGTVEVLGRSAEGDWARARGLMENSPSSTSQMPSGNMASYPMAEYTSLAAARARRRSSPARES